MPHIESVPMGQVPTGADLVRLMNMPCPANLMRAITDTLSDKGLGLEPLAVASVRESPRLTPRLTNLDDLPDVATDAETKQAVFRAWLRFWFRSPGVWFNAMPPDCVG